MASTSNPQKATSLDKSGKPSPKRSPDAQKQPSKLSKSKGSMGLGLIMLAISTSLVGLGGLGYLVYQELVSALGREAEQAAAAKTQTIEARLSSVSQSVDTTATTATKTWQQPKPKVVTPYQNLLVDLLKSDSVVAGAGIVSEGNLLPPPAKGVSIYVWQQKSGIKIEPAGKPLATDLLISSRADIVSSDWYKQSVAGKSGWSQPYEALGKKLITYSAPVGDDKTKVAVVNADAIASEILALNSTDSRIGYVVFGANGAVVTGSEQFTAQQSQNPAIAESITGLAQQSVSQPVGIAQSGGNLWAYRKIGNSGLIVAAYLPQSEIVNKLVVLVGGAAVGISAVLAIAILVFVNKLKKRLQPLVEDCDRFLAQNGNPATSTSGDELDHLSASLKSTLQQVKSSEVRLRNELIHNNDEDISRSQQVQQSLAETEMIEAEVGDLLDVVSSMEEGDLTIEAQVNDRATGLVADTLNRLREKLVEIISSVLGTAQQVAKGAADLEELAKTVVLNTAEQAQSVIQGQSLTEQVANIAKQSAEQVNVANLSLQEVRDTVADGQTAINTLTESISVLQTGSAQIVQRMKTLGEFVGLAEQFVQDQGQIASLTQVLALNATLVAARAAEQKDPKQFASVAREFESIAGQVNDLATQTNDGLTVLQQRTSQIQTVVTAIDTEVQNLSGLVSGFTEGVESSQAAFNSIQVATEEVVQIGQSITSSSTEIAEAAGTTATYISEIAQLAERTADLTRSARQQAESMGNQAQQLLQGIQFFRLPTSAIAAINSATNAATKSANIATASIATASTDASAVTTSRSYDSDISDSRYNAISGAIAEEEDDHEIDLGLPTLAVAGAVAGAAALAVNHFSDQQDNSESLDLVIDDQDSEDQNLVTAAPDFAPISDDATENIFALDMQSIQDDTGLELNQNPTTYTDELSEPTAASVLSDGDSGDLAEPVQTEGNDISAIEASLFADLKQEIYDNDDDDEYLIEQVIEQVDDLTHGQDEITSTQDSLFYEEQNVEADLQIMDWDTPIADPLEDVNQEAIADAVIDPMIVSATSSFLEDTEFGTPVALSEEMLANVPASVDFAIPTLADDDDFAIPPIQIESSLDDSNSFFDSDAYNSLMNSETDQNDPFAISYSESTDNDNFSVNLDSVDGDINENTFGNEFTTEYSAESNFEYSLDEISSSADEYGTEYDTGYGTESNFEYSLDESPSDSFAFNLSPETDETDEAVDKPIDDSIIDGNNEGSSDEYPSYYSIDYSLEDNFSPSDNPIDNPSDIDSFNSFTDRLIDSAVENDLNTDSDESEFNLDFSEVLDDEVFEESNDEFDTGFLNRLSEDVFAEETGNEFGGNFTPSLEIDSDDADLGTADLDADLDIDLDADLDMGAVDFSLEAIADDSSDSNLLPAFDNDFEAIASEEEGSFDLSFADSNDLDVRAESGLDLDFNLEEGDNAEIDAVEIDAVEIDAIVNNLDDVSANEFDSLSTTTEQFYEQYDQAVQDFPEFKDQPASINAEPAQTLDNSMIDEVESDFTFSFNNDIDDNLSNDLSDDLSDDLSEVIASDDISEPLMAIENSVDTIGLDNFTDDMDIGNYNFGTAIARDEDNDFSNNVFSEPMIIANPPDLSYAATSNDAFEAVLGFDSFDEEDALDETDRVVATANIFNDLDADNGINLLEDVAEMEDFTEEDDLGIISEVNPVSESLGFDFSDSWLDDIIDDKLDDDDDTSAVFGTFATAVPSLDDFTKSPVSQSNLSGGNTVIDGFSDVLIDDSLEAEDGTEFDFSAFDDLNNLLQTQQPPSQKVEVKPDPQRANHQNENQIAEAQSEIDAFLSSGSLESNEK